MKTRTINVYSFNELSEDAKQKAIEKLFDINLDYEWWEVVYEDAERIGLKLTTFELDYHKIDGQVITSYGEMCEAILAEHGTDCETYKTAMQFKGDFDLPSDETNESELDQREDEFLKAILQDYLIMLRKEYEWRGSKEQIIESIEANEYEFDEKGNLI